MNEKEQAQELCTYTSVKVDDQVLPLAKAAAALAGQKVQDWISDFLNEAAAKALGKKSIKRRPTYKRR